MDVEQMRDFIADLYPYDKWKDKVARMPEDQVMAIYFRNKDKKPVEKKRPTKPKKVEPVQITIDDILRR